MNPPQAFEAIASLDPEGPILTLKGCADSLVLPGLNSAVGGAHLKASEVHARRVVVDMRALQFMNSSCFKAFVSWLNEVRELPAAERYVVEFVTDPALHWQRRSLAALSAFGGDLVRIRTLGAVVA